uniref:Putative basic tail protein n=1 Tax=Rhipicephalus pulchellus TaxID=72859 RepID=L7MBZ8_RHIPC
MAPIKRLLACLFTVAALPKLAAWATGEWYCHRLVPLQITSVVTPCAYPCVLRSPQHDQTGIILRQEQDGTPCKVAEHPSVPIQMSRCRNGVCQLPELQLQLKRTKREIKLRRKRRGLVKAIKNKHKKRKEKKRRKKEEKKRAKLAKLAKENGKNGKEKLS